MALDIKPIIYAEEYHEDKPSIFRESENLDRLLQAIFDVCYQQQLDFLWLSQNLLNVDVAEKSHLDFIGNIVGQPRFLSDFNTEPYFGYEGSYQSKPFSSVTNPDIGGFWNSRSHFNTATARQLNDDEYRRLIKARAIYNQSNCTANDLLEVVNLITDSDDNTVQLLKHGLVQIKTSDKTGILSYFVDRLYLEDNILPIAAGVRVGLEEVGESDVIPDTDWEVKKVYEGSTGSKVGIDAVRTKNNSEVESSIEVTPTVGQISDRIKSGEYGAEVNKAVLDIEPEAIDWVLDPANNRIKYTIPAADGDTSTTSPRYATVGTTKYYDAVPWCRAYAVSSRKPANYYNKALVNGTYFDCYLNDVLAIHAPTVVNPDYVGGVPEEKYLPISTVAAKVIANAESGHEESKSLIVSVVSVLASMKVYDPLF